MKETRLCQKHIVAGAKMVDFAGWNMPLHYGSQIQEHHAIRSSAGVFDVSHMVFRTTTGRDAERFIRQLICGDVKSVANNQGLYSCILKDNGGILDDLIVYKIDTDSYAMITNAGTADKVSAWITQQAAGMEVENADHPDKHILAIQGPQARTKFAEIFPEFRASQIARFKFEVIDEVFIARTGYTGEDGYEVIVSSDRVEEMWDRLIAGGVIPAGLGCRDSLRLESGFSLYGNDLDEEHSPLASALSWVVNWNDSDDGEQRDFTGRAAMLKEKEDGVKQRLVGLYITTPGVLRDGAKVQTKDGEGMLTSGGFSPTLKHGVGLARIPVSKGAGNGGDGANGATRGAEDACEVEVRGKMIDAKIIRPPFVKDGKPSAKISHTK